MSLLPPEDSTPPEDFDEREERFIHDMFEVFRTLLPVPTEDFTERLFERLESIVEEDRLQSPALDDILVSLVVESVGMITSWFPTLPDEPISPNTPDFPEEETPHETLPENDSNEEGDR